MTSYVTSISSLTKVSSLTNKPKNHVETVGRMRFDIEVSLLAQVLGLAPAGATKPSKNGAWGLPETVELRLAYVEFGRVRGQCEPRDYGHRLRIGPRLRIQIHPGPLEPAHRAAPPSAA